MSERRVTEPRGRRRQEQVTIRLPASLKRDVAHCAATFGMSQNAFCEEALRQQVRAATAQHTETTVAPLLKDLVLGAVTPGQASMRRLVVRLAYEVIRQQYLMCEFMVRAGFKPGELETLRDDGWAWAVKMFKQQPPVSADDDQA